MLDAGCRSNWYKSPRGHRMTGWDNRTHPGEAADVADRLGFIGGAGIGGPMVFGSHGTQTTVGVGPLLGAFRVSSTQILQATCGKTGLPPPAVVTRANAHFLTLACPADGCDGRQQAPALPFGRGHSGARFLFSTAPGLGQAQHPPSPRPYFLPNKSLTRELCPGLFEG